MPKLVTVYGLWHEQSRFEARFENGTFDITQRWLFVLFVLVSCNLSKILDNVVAVGIPSNLRQASNGKFYSHLLERVLDLPTFLEKELNGKYNSKSIGSGSYGNCYKLNLLKNDDIYKKLTAYLAKSGKAILNVQFKSKKFVIKKAHFNCTEEIQNEIKILRELHDPRIIRICGIITKPGVGQIGYIAPFIDGQDLYHLIKSRREAEQRTGRNEEPQPRFHEIFFGLVRALYFLAEKHIIHADFNPNNIMVTSDFEVVIIDFGFSSKTSAIGVSGVGTDTFRPKELEEGLDYGLQADIYYLATTAYYLYTAKVPGNEFTNGSFDSRLIARACNYLHGRECIHSQNPKCTIPSCRPFRPDMDVYGAELRELLKKCWDLNPADRPAIITLKNQLDIWTIWLKLKKSKFIYRCKMIIWSDENKFNCDGSDGTQSYLHDLRKKNHNFSRKNFKTDEVMVFAAFHSTGRVKLCFVSKKMNSNDYQNCLERSILPFWRRSRQRNLVFMQDNAPIRRSRGTMAWLGSKRIDVLEWPANSDFCPKKLRVKFSFGGRFRIILA